MIEEFEKIGSGFDDDFLACKLSAVPLCHICQYKVWDQPKGCKKFGEAPEKYVFDSETTDCKGLKINEDSMFYYLFEERIRKGEVKNGTKA